MTQPNILAAHPGEHNARRRAMIKQAEARKDTLAAITATYDFPILRSDGSKCPHYVDGFLDYPAKAEVAAIHRSLALAYSVQNRVVMPRAMDATAWEAFLVYDAARVELAA